MAEGAGAWQRARLAALVRGGGTQSERLGRRVERLVVWLAVGLVLYLPFEPAALGTLEGPAYWLPRLAPDGLIVLAALAVLLPGVPRRRAGTTILLGIGVAAAALLVVYRLRGVGPVDTVNQLRVLLRYAVLAACLLSVVRDPARALRLLAAAIAVSVTYQAVAALAELAGLLWPVIVRSGASPDHLLGMGGTIGRYDRLGFLMAAGLVLALAGGVPGPRRLGPAVFVLAAVGLLLSSSRQALLGAAAAGLLLAVVPAIGGRTRVLRVATAAGCLVAVALLSISFASAGAGSIALASTSAARDAAHIDSSGGRPIEAVRADLSLDPRLNFRLYLTLKLVPFVASQDPLLGFGPGRHQGDEPDPRLRARVEADGVPWSRAQQYMNDSNYASLALQYGLFLPFLLLGLMAGVALRLWRGLAGAGGGAGARIWLEFGLAYLAVCLVGAAFGPAFETRTVSIVLWLGLFGGALAIAGSAGRPARASRDGIAR